MMPNVKKEGIILQNGKFELSGTMKVPGFIVYGYGLLSMVEDMKASQLQDLNRKKSSLQ